MIILIKIIAGIIMGILIDLIIRKKDQEEIEHFKTESKKLKEAITRSPSVENFKKYEDFLNRYPKRMVRT